MPQIISTTFTCHTIYAPCLRKPDPQKSIHVSGVCFSYDTAKITYEQIKKYILYVKKTNNKRTEGHRMFTRATFISRIESDVKLPQHTAAVLTLVYQNKSYSGLTTLSQ